MIRTIHLHGRLGKKYGRTHRYDVATPAEAIRALNANHPGFANELVALGEKGYAYRVLHGRRAQIGLSAVEELNDPASGDIRIIPEIAGAKKGGLGQLLAGIAMVALVYFTGGAASAFWSTTIGGAKIGTMVASIGMSMAIGGVVQMLASTSKSEQAAEDKKDPSYIFNGAINTMAQGHPVPVGYGEMIVGSAVISAGISVDEVPIVPAGPTWTNPATGNVEPYPPPTLVWDGNLNTWTLPDGKELLSDSNLVQTGFGWDSETWVEVRSNFRTEDGRIPTLTATPERWDIPAPTAFATPKKINGIWHWFIRSGAVRITFSTANKRFEVPGAAPFYDGEGGLGDVGSSDGSGSAGDGNAGDGGTGGGDGSGSGGGSASA